MISVNGGMPKTPQQLVPSEEVGAVAVKVAKLNYEKECYELRAFVAIRVGLSNIYMEENEELDELMRVHGSPQVNPCERLSDSPPECRPESPRAYAEPYERLSDSPPECRPKSPQAYPEDYARFIPIESHDDWKGKGPTKADMVEIKLGIIEDSREMLESMGIKLNLLGNLYSEELKRTLDEFEKLMKSCDGDKNKVLNEVRSGEIQNLSVDELAQPAIQAKLRILGIPGDLQSLKKNRVARGLLSQRVLYGKNLVEVGMQLSNSPDDPIVNNGALLKKAINDGIGSREMLVERSTFGGFIVFVKIHGMMSASDSEKLGDLYFEGELNGKDRKQVEELLKQKGINLRELELFAEYDKKSKKFTYAYFKEKTRYYDCSDTVNKCLDDSGALSREDLVRTLETMEARDLIPEVIGALKNPSNATEEERCCLKMRQLFENGRRDVFQPR